MELFELQAYCNPVLDKQLALVNYEGEASAHVAAVPEHTLMVSGFEVVMVNMQAPTVVPKLAQV